MMTNGDQEGRIFLSRPHTINGFFHQFKRVVLRLKTDPVLIVLRSVFLYITKLDLL